MRMSIGYLEPLVIIRFVVLGQVLFSCCLVSHSLRETRNKNSGNDHVLNVNKIAAKFGSYRRLFVASNLDC